MKVGDKVKCTGNVSRDDFYTVGEAYVIESFDIDGDPCLRDNHGDLDETCGQPLKGVLWQFELLD